MKFGSFYFLLLLIQGLSVIQAQSSNQTCEDIVEKFIGAILTKQTPALSMQTIMGSGKGFNDLGNKVYCDANDYQYLVMKLGSAIGIVNIGVCLPLECTQSEMEKYGPLTVLLMNGLIPNAFYFAIYQDPELVYPHFGTGPILVLILLIIIILLNVAGSFITFYQKFSRKNNQILKNPPKQQLLLNNGESGYQSGIGDQSTPDDISHQELNQSQQYAKYANPEIVKYSEQELLSIKLLKCFSFVANFKKLFTVKQGDDSFKVFNGIRVLSMCWVIYGHDYLIRSSYASNIISLTDELVKPGLITLAPSAYFSVDVFFFLGGFLVAVLGVDKIAKMRKIKPMLVFQMWFHRLIRIWPTYVICILIYWKLTIFWSGGPLWGDYIYGAKYCDEQWWRNFLLIDDMWYDHDKNGYCFGWGWYLSNDFQIFLLTPILLILYVKSPKLCVGILVAMFMGSVLAAYLIAYHYDYHVNMPSKTASFQANYSDIFYYKPWIRISPYIIGILYGLCFREYKNKTNRFLEQLGESIRQSWTIRICLYIIGAGLVSAICWMIVPLQKDMSSWPPQLHYFYQAFNRVFFVIGLAMVITPSLLKAENDPITKILGIDFWVPLARISFCVYLVQLIVIQFTTLNAQGIPYMNATNIIFYILGDTFYSIVFGGLLSLMVEVPGMNIEKMLTEMAKQTKLSSVNV